jgi:hypothetical protein
MSKNSAMPMPLPMSMTLPMALPTGIGAALGNGVPARRRLTRRGVVTTPIRST